MSGVEGERAGRLVVLAQQVQPFHRDDQRFGDRLTAIQPGEGRLQSARAIGGKLRTDR